MSNLVLLSRQGELPELVCFYQTPATTGSNVVFADTTWLGDGWSNWQDLGGQVAPAMQIAAAVEQNGQIEGFYVDQAGILRMGSTVLGTGYYIADFTVGQNQDGRLEVFAVDAYTTPLHLYETAPNNGWSGWAFLGQGGIKFAQQAPAVGLNLDGSLQVFAVDGAGSPRYITQDPNGPNGGWTNWNFLGTGYKIAQLAVAQNKDGRLEVFAVDQAGVPLHIWQTTPGGGWSEWALLGQGGISIQTASTDGVIAAALDNEGWLEAFAVNTQGAPLRIQQNPSGPNSGWTDWVALGVINLAPGSPPIAVTAYDGGYLVAATLAPGTEGPLWITQQASNVWQDVWEVVGTSPSW